MRVLGQAFNTSFNIKWPKKSRVIFRHVKLAYQLEFLARILNKMIVSVLPTFYILHPCTITLNKLETWKVHLRHDLFAIQLSESMYMYVCKSIVIYVSVSYALYRLSPDKIISSFFIVKYFLAYDNISGVSNSKYSKSSYVLLYFIDICNSVEVFVKVHIPDGSTKCCLMKPYTTKTNYIYFFSEKTGNPGSL